MSSFGSKIVAVHKKEAMDAKVIANPVNYKTVKSHFCSIVQPICPHGYSPVSELFNYPWYRPHDQLNRFKKGTVQCLQNQYLLSVGEAREKYGFNHWAGYGMQAMHSY